MSNKALRFFRRMWWFVIAGGFLMLAGLVMKWVREDLHWYSTGLIFAGTTLCMVGYGLILWYDWRHRDDRPIDRGQL